MFSAPPIIITGFMCSGKTTIGAALASRLNRAFIDLDEIVRQQTGQTPAQLISVEGEQLFRAIEAEALAQVLETKNSVIALGGGTWITEGNRDLIQRHGARTFWLDAPFSLCWQRIQTSAADRPLAPSEGEARRLYDARRRYYELADEQIDISESRSIEDVCADITRSIN